MKSSEAKDLSTDELETLRSLMQRWFLTAYPSEEHLGSSSCSDALQTYLNIERHTKQGFIRYANSPEDYVVNEGEFEMQC